MLASINLNAGLVRQCFSVANLTVGVFVDAFFVFFVDKDTSFVQARETVRFVSNSVASMVTSKNHFATLLL
jgi:hypothetical protein